MNSTTAATEQAASSSKTKQTKTVPTSRYVVFFILVVLGTFWDLYSKSVVFESLGYPAGQSDWTRTFFNGWVQLQLYTNFNEGALWGMGQGYTALFAILSIGAAVGILCWLFLFRAARSLWLTITLALVMSGTIGNLYDRLAWHGYEVAGRTMYAVRDFLAFTFGTYHYPIFNFADVFLVTGAIMLAVYSLFMDLPESDKQETAKKQAPSSGA